MIYRPPMRLQQYRELRNITRQQAADEMGVDQSAVWRWEKGKAIPMPKQIMLISEWSHGVVTANDFIGVQAQIVSRDGGE